MIFYCPNCWRELSDGQRLCALCHRAVSAWDEKTFEAKLLQAILHPEPMTQNRAVYLLGEKKSSQALGPLAELFRQTLNPFLKSEIVEAAAKIGGEGACSLLIEALRDPSFIVRGKAVEALADFSGSDIVERELKHCLVDPSSYVRGMARRAIDSLGG